MKLNDKWAKNNCNTELKKSYLCGNCTWFTRNLIHVYIQKLATTDIEQRTLFHCSQTDVQVQEKLSFT